MGRREVGRLAAAWLLGLALASGAQANSDWPAKPVKILVPFPAGGTSDGTARILAQRLGEAFGQQFIVENRGGASGAIAAEAVAHAPADGYTLFWATLTQIAIAPAVAKTSYDPVKDFAPISLVGTNPFVLFVNAKVPVKTLPEFVAHARHTPNGLTYGAAGAGSMTHLTTALFLKHAGVALTPVMYRGSAPAMTDLLAGQIDALFSNVSFAVPYANGGAIRLLAVSSAQRVAQLPDVPTFVESGFPGFTALTWNGLMAPAGTPREIIDRIAAEVARAVKEPKIVELLAKSGIDPLSSSPEEFSERIAADMKLWAEAVAVVGVLHK